MKEVLFYCVVDETDFFHNIDIATVETIDEAKKVRINHINNYPDSKVNIYGVYREDKKKWKN